MNTRVRYHMGALCFGSSFGNGFFEQLLSNSWPILMRDSCNWRHKVRVLTLGAFETLRTGQKLVEIANWGGQILAE
eukprot:3452896-Amphidinium_carterae.1